MRCFIAHIFSADSGILPALGLVTGVVDVAIYNEEAVLKNKSNLYLELKQLVQSEMQNDLF